MSSGTVTTGGVVVSEEPNCQRLACEVRTTMSAPPPDGARDRLREARQGSGVAPVPLQARTIAPSRQITTLLESTPAGISDASSRNSSTIGLAAVAGGAEMTAWNPRNPNPLGGVPFATSS